MEHHPSSYWEQPFSQPYFDNTTKRETTTTVGQSAYLHCRVRNLGDRAVSPKFPYQELVVVITAPKFGNLASRYAVIASLLNIANVLRFRFRRLFSTLCLESFIYIVIRKYIYLFYQFFDFKKYFYIIYFSCDLCTFFRIYIFRCFIAQKCENYFCYFSFLNENSFYTRFTTCCCSNNIIL